MNDENLTKNNKNNIFIYLIIGLVVIGLIFFISTRSQANKMVSNSTQPAELKSISLSEISSHNTETSCWTTINSNVYDLTKFIPKHNGGNRILQACGIDATDLFTGKSPMGRMHSAMAQKLLSGMQIGTLQK